MRRRTSRALFAIGASTALVLAGSSATATTGEEGSSGGEESVGAEGTEESVLTLEDFRTAGPSERQAAHEQRMELLRLAGIDTDAIPSASRVAPESSSDVRAPMADSEIDVPDDSLRACINDALGKDLTDEITQAEAESFEILVCGSLGISDLTGMEHMTNLEDADFYENNISDLGPLAGLTSLSLLGVDFNEIVDVSPLSGLSGLEQLFLSSNRINDLSPLADLPSLDTLWLDDNEVSDLSPLTGMTGLDIASFQRNDVSDLSPLAGLNVSYLDFGDNNISDVSPLQDLDSLEDLYLDFNEIVDVSPLGELSLGTLYVSEQSVDIGQVLVPVDNPVVGLDGEPVPLDDPSYNEADNTFYPAPGTDSVSWDDGDAFDGELLFFAYHEDLVVTMGEADATFERLYEWTIDKSANTDGEVDERNEATFDYVVAVEPEAIDSEWRMSGQVTVENRDQHEVGQVTVDVSVQTDIGAECVVEDGMNVTLDHQEVRDFDFICTFSEQPDYEGTATATATFMVEDEELSVSDEGPVAFAVDSVVDEVVEVWDDHTDPENPVLLGEADAADPDSWVFTYSLVLPGVVGEVVEFTNTAWVEAAAENPTASAMVGIDMTEVPEPGPDPEDPPTEAGPALPDTGAPLAGAAALALLLTMGGLALSAPRRGSKV